MNSTGFGHELHKGLWEESAFFEHNIFLLLKRSSLFLAGTCLFNYPFLLSADLFNLLALSEFFAIVCPRFLNHHQQGLDLSVLIALSLCLITSTFYFKSWLELLSKVIIWWWIKCCLHKWILFLFDKILVEPPSFAGILCLYRNSRIFMSTILF